MAKHEIFVKSEPELSSEEITKRIREIVNGYDADGSSSGYDATPIFTVKEFAKELQVSVHTVRYYDKEHLFPYVQRTEGNERMFSRADLAYGKMIICLRGLGLSIRDCHMFILHTMEGDGTVTERLNMLLVLQNQLKKEIAELNTALSDLQFKIRYYSYLNDIVYFEKESGNYENKNRGTLRNLHEFILRQKNMLPEQPQSQTKESKPE
ncbi:MAG: MerR family transcriptional regulator [Erysipelotrichaceae bacterium]|nr:MerR family transcriptional regulator [Erysipelotrichaceae bacterium]